jgi:hypothetical protein
LVSRVATISPRRMTDTIIRRGHDLTQFVRDQQDGFAFVLKNFKDFEKVIRLGRRQNAGGFIQDQDFGAAIESFQNFDTLLMPTGSSPVIASGSTSELIFGFQAMQFGSGPVKTAGQKRTVFGAKNDVFKNGEIVDQHEVLVNHADAHPEMAAFESLIIVTLLPSTKNVAIVGLIEAVEDRHQC